MIRWLDEQLPDMHDHNFFFIEGLATEADVVAALSLQMSRGDNFIKLESHQKMPAGLVAHFNLEEECTLTMVRNVADVHGWTINPKVDVKNLHDDTIAEEFLALELEIFGSPNNLDFINRKMARYFNMVAAQPTLNFYAAYIEGHIAGSLFTFYDGTHIAIDGLAVREKYRNTYVATTLIKHVIEAYNCPAYLHASQDETSKDLYAKLGFKTTDYTYEYFANLTHTNFQKEELYASKTRNK